MCRLLLWLSFLLLTCPAWAAAPSCNSGVVYADRNGNGRRDAGEPGIAGVQLSDGRDLVRSDRQGRYQLPVVAGRTVFVIKPAGYRLGRREDGLPDFWRHVPAASGPTLKYGGIVAASPGCRDFGLLADAHTTSDRFDVVVMTDPQPKSLQDVDYYRRDIIASITGTPASRSQLGLSLGDIVNDDLSLYPALNRATATLGVPWLHVPGNHDLDTDAARDEDSLLTFRNTYGPDTLAWEEREAVFVTLDDVVFRPQTRDYIGGLREDQFAFLEHYLPTVPKDRLLVVGVHIPFFDAVPGRETFRHADRERLFALLAGFPHVLLLSGHAHGQRHYFHGPAQGWHGAEPLHEYNVGAACGAFWSGVKDAQGIPDSTMSDGTPNGYATLQVEAQGAYRLAWHPARDVDTPMALHAPRILRHGAWPGTGIYANVFMGQADTRVEFRVDDGPWTPMQRVVQPDPRVWAENLRDDEAAQLRGYDRAPEAEPSQHLWRGALPTDLAVGEHRVRVRAFGVQPNAQVSEAATSYRLADAGN